MNKQILTKIGLAGWDAQEPVVLAALIADLPLMLYGLHGQAKTQGARAIARSLLGKTCKFQPYDFSRLSKDELIGVMDPNKLKSGELSYIPSPHTVWGADAVLFDEFTRANVMLGSLAHEILLSKTIMGMKTTVKLSLAACNPPSVYETNYMDLATASRFVMIPVPGPNDLSQKDVEQILIADNDFESPPDVLRVLVTKCRNVEFSSESKSEAAKAATLIKDELNRFDGIKFSIRQTSYLYKLILASEALKALGYPCDENDLVQMVLSIVPELSGLVSIVQEIPRDQVEMRIKTVVIGMTIGDPILGGASLSEILDADREDLIGWAGAVVKQAAKADPDEIRDAIRSLKDLRTDLEHRPDLFNSMFHTLLLTYLEKGGVLPARVKNKILSTASIKRLVKEI